MDWNLKKKCQFFQIIILMLRHQKSSRNLLWLAHSDKIHSISSSWLYRRHSVKEQSLKVMILAQNWSKTAKPLWHCLFKKAICVYLCDSHFKVLLCDMNSSFPQSIHACFCTNTLKQEHGTTGNYTWTEKLFGKQQFYKYVQSLQCCLLKLLVTCTCTMYVHAVSSIRKVCRANR